MACRWPLLADFPPASRYSVKVPPDLEDWYQVAAPICLSLAALFGGFWLLKRKSLTQPRRHALLLALAGSLAAAYTAAWTWEHRAEWNKRPTSDLVAAAEMPFLWLSFCLAAFLIARWRNPKQANSIAAETRPAHWRLLGVLMLVGASSVLIFNKIRMEHIPILLFTIISWGVVISYALENNKDGWLETIESRFAFSAVALLGLWLMVLMARIAQPFQIGVPFFVPCPRY